MRGRANLVSNHQIVAEASEWFAAFRFDDVDAAARARFSEWLRRSPEHIQAYLELSRLWAEMPGGEARHRIDIETLLAASKTSAAEIIPLSTAAASSTPERTRARVPRQVLLAASVAFVSFLAAAMGWWWLNRYPEYRTGIGEQRSITLADGSSLDLNADSAVRVRFKRGLREVDLLAGQALFRVSKDKHRPFVVVAGARQVVAVGTQFDVYRHENSTIVTVLEGRVAVTPTAADAAPIPESLPGVDPNALVGRAETDLLFVDAGEQAVVTAQSVVKPKHADVAAATAWLHKKLVFEATPLSQVVEQFNRYNRRPLIIDDQRLATVGVSGVYSSTDPSSLLLFLRDQPGIRIVETEQAVRITFAAP